MAKAPSRDHAAADVFPSVRALAMLSLRFDQPAFLLLGLLAVPLLILGWRAMAMTDSVRRAVALSLRAAVLLALAFMLAGPHMLREHNQLTVIGLLDISGSVRRFANLPAITQGTGGISQEPGQTEATAQVEPDQSAPPALSHSNLAYLRNWFRQATQTKAPDDRFGLVVFDGRAIAISAPTRGTYIDDNLDEPIAQGTNIEEAVRLGLAMFPADTAKRLVLVSDGNQTAGDVMEAIRHLGAADLELSTFDLGPNAGGASRRRSSTWKSTSSIPIDILPIAYHVTNDVQVVRIEAPPTAQPGQTVLVRVILEAASPTAGHLTLRREGVPVDLNDPEPGTKRFIDLPAGQSVHFAQVTLGKTPINRFEAIFEADDPTADVLPDNDRAEAFTATPSRGAVLVLDRRAGERESRLAEILNAAELPAETKPPSAMPDDLLSLQNYDLIVLNNVGAFDLTARQQERLIRYINDLGGGLIMIGGENAFGAGGWNNTPLEAMLPVELDPRKELRLPTAALVLVLDKSGSMNQSVAGARATQQEIANEGAALAIESLRADSLVGVVTFDMFAQTVLPLQPNENPKKLAERVRAITADGGTNIEPGLNRAYEMLKDAKVAKKHVVCLSDGRSPDTDLSELARRMASDNIQITTIAVGDDADHDTLRKLAEIGGGAFYPVRDPRMLPRVLVDSVKVINRPLIKNITFVPQVLATGSTLTAGMDQAPPLDGLVITSPREDPKVTLEMVDPDGDPVLAHWQAGLGRVAAFTSDIDGVWSRRWDDWPTADAFWVQLARTIARPAMSQDAELIATIRDDRLDISFEMAAPNAGGFLDYLQVDGMVYKPDGSAVPVRLRQGAPGRYEASVDATLAGNYVVALNPRQGERQLAPVIGGTSRSTSPEFRRYQSNLGLLEQIVELTNGRRLDITNPLAVDLFDRAGMPPSFSSLPVWRTILLWAIALLLLDVACRRIAWDYAMVRGFAQRAIARVRPASLRGQEAATTLATLRKVSDEIESRHEANTAGVQKLRGIGRIMPPPPRETYAAGPHTSASMDQTEASGETSQSARTGAQQPDSSKVAAAIDALFGRRSPRPDTPAPPPPTSSTTPEQGAGSAETTSNLLAAKRRARRRLEGEADGQP